MLCVLIIIFRHDRIATGQRITGKVRIFFSNMTGITANFHVRTIALEIPVHRIAGLTSTTARAVSIITIIIIVVIVIVIVILSH